MPRTALIVGAGIGGLSAGIALRKAGWTIRIFERSASPRELGFGLALAPNAMAALDELGVGGEVLARGFEPTRGELRRMDGTVLKRAEIPRRALGGPMVVALRAALHGSLLDAVGLDTIAVGKEAVSFDARDARVTLRLSNGEVAEGDLLVGADGVHSVIRRALHPDEGPPRSSGLVAVRGAVHGAMHHMGDLTGVYYLGPGVEAFLVRASDTGIYWALSLSRRIVPPGLVDASAILAHMLPQMDATFRAVTSSTTDLRVDELVDRDPIPSWGVGPVTLLGDAAHPMLPHTGQGAAQAIVDAVTLGKALAAARDVAAATDVNAALRAYERDRMAKTATLVAQGRRTARLMRMRHPLGCAARDLVLRMLPVKPLMKLIVRVNRRAGTDITDG
jgi:2-polyprenyl-6-methoxyphenol hydroxylase-like FAD-dependent oxidoreductase